MLVQFSATNYRSLKSKATLSMLAGKDTGHESDLFVVDSKKRLLPVAAIYGANSSGKSNILLAMQTMQDMITGSSAQLLKDKKLPYDPFAFINDAGTLPTEFEIIFYYDGIKYAYGFSYNAKKILTETLYHWPKGREALIFSRNEDTYEFRENEKEQTILAGRTPANKLYLVSSNEWNSPQTELAYKWFTERLLPYDDHNMPEVTIKAVKDASPLKKRVLKELLLADLGIAGVGVTDKDTMQSENDIVLMVHKTEDDSGVKKFPLPLKQESRGTQRFFARIGPWIQSLEKGGVMLVDEIEASLHPLLTRRLVEMVQNPEININKAQLIFTTHDALLLDLSLLRRDQIWFTDKDPQSLATELFSLWDFSARKDENIQKRYLEGRYGAIPFFGGDAKWLEE